MPCEDPDDMDDPRHGQALPAEELDAFAAFLLEHTGLPWRIIQTVLDANDAFWNMKMAQWGRTTQWAQGEPWDDDSVEPDGG